MVRPLGQLMLPLQECVFVAREGNFHVLQSWACLVFLFSLSQVSDDI